MPRISLKDLNLKGFQTFLTDAHLEFPDNGVVLVNGENLDTKGSSGSGKTNLVGSIAYLLGYSELPATELKSWHTEEMEVSGTLSTDKGLVKIKRGTGGLRVEINNIESKGSAAEKEIQKLHGLPSAFLETMTYRPQQKPGKPSGGFLGMGPTDKAKFLSRLLDLDRFETEFEKSKKIIDSLEIKHESLRENFERTSDEKNQAEQALSDWTDLDFGVDDAADSLAVLREKVGEVNKRIERAERERDQAQASESVLVRQIQKDFTAAEEKIRNGKPDLTELQEKLEILKNRLSEVSITENENKKLFNAKINALKQKASALNQIIISFGNLDEQIQTAQSALTAIQNMACNVCKRPWDGPEQLNESNRLGLLLRHLGSDLEAKQGHMANFEDLQDQIAEEYVPDPNVSKLNTLIDKIEKTIAVKKEAWGSQQSTELMSLRLDRRSAMERVVAGSAAVSATIMKLRGIANKINLSLAESEKRLAVAEEQTRSHGLVKIEKQQRVTRAREILLGIKLQMDALAKDIAEEKDFAALIGRSGYLGMIFDEVLEDISQSASSIMSTIPNVSHCSIRLSPVKTTKTGERKAITPVIYINGVERPFQSCSGGMTNSITLAVDLALSKVIAERTGTRLGWMIFDECFDGMDLPTKEACIELLRDTAETENLLIFVIDHDASLKEMFDKVITIKFRDGKSWIETRYSED